MTYTVEDAKRDGWRGRDAEAYAQFINDVNKWVVRRCGLSIEDMPDWNWADEFMAFNGDADGLAQRFLKEVGADFV